MAKKTSDYWKERVRREEAKAQRTASRYAQKEYKLYSGAARRLNSRINALYAEIQDKGWDEISRTNLWNLKSYAALRQQIYEECRAIGLKEKDLTDEALFKVFDDLGVIENQSLALTTKVTAERIINGEWSGKNYSQRLYENAETLAKRLEEKITDVVIAGKAPAAARKELQNEFGMSFHQADRLVRTEASHTFNEASLENYKSAGVEYVEILDCSDDRVCDDCGDISGQIYPMNEAPILPLHPNCRCCYVPVLEDDDNG